MNRFANLAEKSRDAIPIEQPMPAPTLATSPSRVGARPSPVTSRGNFRLPCITVLANTASAYQALMAEAFRGVLRKYGASPFRN